ncbi:DinB family protein [Thiocystis violascens]|uniref:Uncharacterized protein n=1 Tax=Thiocystis violascens (strain ATCC 17096 / DSM 198 / 6111) TaxID=765911 RepID=I3YBK3_THIV6|nr:DinB family protein [Thiocystis violascens]AFL74371.1 hypothetical protein Thivi_2429 [Thiocystis violascens DSM 198]
MIPRAPDDLKRSVVGIPVHERWVADLGIRGYASFASPASILRLFRAEAGRAIVLSRRLPREQASRIVTIRRFPGIEDSSRHWSVYMTLDHLAMVNTAITALLHAMCSGCDHEIEIQNEDVWPHADVGSDRIQALGATVERYSRLIERLGPLNARARHPHPWFGPLTARQWHALAAIHNRTHRIQIEKIVRRLN